MTYRDGSATGSKFIDAIGREPDGVGPSLAAGDSGDERYLAVKQAKKVVRPADTTLR